MKLYAVKSKDGKYFRPSGQSYRDQWVGLEDAKLYSKLGQARARVTFWSNHAPQYGTPSIVELEVKIIGILDEKEYIKLAKNTKAGKDLRVKKREIKLAKKKYEEALAKLK